jgi:tetratricopeptide (TPR) repeat protein
MTSQESLPIGREPSDSASASTTTESRQSEPPVEQVSSLLKQGRLESAVDLARRALQDWPNHPELLYLEAVCLRYLGLPLEALKVLQRLMTVNPGFARSYQEAGHNFLGLDRFDEALGAFRQAVTLNPALSASWQKLHNLHARLGDDKAAEHAMERLERLRQLPRELLSVTSMLHEGKLYKAEMLCRSFLQKNPKNVEGMRLLAELGVRLMVFDDAEFLLESCVEFEPDNVLARYDYARVLHKRQKFAKALEEAKKLRLRKSGDPAFELLYANESVAVGDYDAALEIYEHVIKEHPELPGTYLVRGHALKTIGRNEEAIRSYRDAIAARPDFGDAYWSLANLKTYRFSDDDIERMKEQEARSSTVLEDRYHLCFALGKAFEDRQQYEDAFRFYELGNALKKKESNYSAKRIEKEIGLQKEICSASLLNRDSAHGYPAPDPIFIVGLPRAGSTLLEQILASHPHVEGTMELPNILATAHRLNGRRLLGDDPRYPGILEELTEEQLRSLGEKYIEDTRIFRTGTPYFIDKMPNNFRHIGLIHLILPNAKIIDARRNPMACCFSGFKQLFAEGQEFTYDLQDIGQYYRSYVELMDHWDEVLPGKVLRVQYEEVVDGLEEQVRRILDHCELPFDERCMRFHETSRPVRTPSSEQVRQPIYKSGKEQWRNFKEFLGPLEKALAG